MPRKKQKSTIPCGPRGWITNNELDYFTMCPVCGEWFDCRDVSIAAKHRHGGKPEVVLKHSSPTRRPRS